MRAHIAVLPGDGIGVEVVAWGARVLQHVADAYGHTFRVSEGSIGGNAIDATGSPLPDASLALCKQADATFVGAVGGPKWDVGPPEARPEYGLLRLRKELRLYANLRPVKAIDALVDSSPLRREIVEGTDLLVLRELTGGLYFGRPRGRSANKQGIRVKDTLTYTSSEMERIIRLGFDLARQRRKQLASVDKANVLASSGLWREIAEQVADDYPDVQVEHILVDACAMHLVNDPRRFDVLVTENMFGDILSDEASVLAGSLGMLPSASLGRGRRGLYEPVHGTAPDIVGQDKANPVAAILSVAMLLRHSLGLEQEARAVEVAVEDVLAAGYRTPDLARGATGERAVGTEAMGEAVLERIG
ncbi:MAG: 3-isopropylmalate dehydrogenase [Chloroflexota bacterium]|nr:3-isopropylmalate dehydrogenase [Chloroflexota bacterium]MDE2929396.1 3-isopropylmalate dehydrogenase [Chloroflexota bacterium]